MVMAAIVSCRGGWSFQAGDKLVLVRRASMDPFISAAKRAQPGFNALHQPECESALSLSGTPADRTIRADSGQGLVE